MRSAGLSPLGGESAVVLVVGLVATMPVVASDGAAEAHLYYHPTLGAQASAQTLVALAQ